MKRISKEILKTVIDAAVKASAESKFSELGSEFGDLLTVEKPRNPEFGDYAVNVSPLAKILRLPPPKIAEIIVAEIKTADYEINNIGGFINFKAGKNKLNEKLGSILEKKENYGKNSFGEGQKVLLEYISANPTGPLHIGHGRWAAFGSALANLMKFSGYELYQEFYINDAGNQIKNLGRSLWIRILQNLGQSIDFPAKEEDGAKNYYAGEYLIPVAEQFLKNNKEQALKWAEETKNPLEPTSEIVTELSDFAKKILLEQQKELLENFRVKMDYWYSETDLHKQGKVESAIEKLKKSGEIYEKEGALWFKSSKYGDDQDRVIVKSDGSYTYLTADIAYHFDKIQRGYDLMINIWGADHHGYVPRMKAAIEAFGYNPDRLEVLLGQLVNLIIDGEQVRMGKRRKMLTLDDLIEEVGIDATRYWMIMRSIDTALDFDVELAKSCSDENPVYYAQYAHARVSGILRNAVGERFDADNNNVLPPFYEKEELNKLFEASEFDIKLLDGLWATDNENELVSTKNLIIKLESFEDNVLSAVKYRAPYRIAKYLEELAKDFHHFYTFTRVLNVEKSVMSARLSLVFAVKQVLKTCLNILGVDAPESM